jgi:MFS family permease
MRHWRLVGTITGWQVTASVIYYSVYVATPFFKDTYGLTAFEVGLTITALTISYAIFLLPLGAMVDRLGERWMLTAGLAGLSIGAITVALSWSYLSLLAAVFVLGSVYGTAIPGTNKAIFDQIAPGRQNLAMGIKQVGITAGSGISAVFITSIAAVATWQIGFLGAALFGLIIAAIFGVSYRVPVDAGVASFPDLRAIARSAPYRALTMSGFFLGVGLFTTTAYTILYLNVSVGLSVAAGGLVLAGIQITGSVGRVLTGWIADHVGGAAQQVTIRILLVQAIGGVISFGAVVTFKSPTLAVVSLLFVGFFAVGFTAMYYSCLGTLVPPAEMGGATAGAQLSLTLGSVVGPPTFGYMADTFGYSSGWTMLMLAAAVGVAFILQLFRLVPTSSGRTKPV